MIRMSRMTDYGFVLMSYMAADAGRMHNAAEVAAEVHIPLPTVSKLMRVLARSGLLVSHRGVKGGYSLARKPEEISLAQIIRALEGPIGLTLCTAGAPGDCDHDSFCPIRGHWQRINHAIFEALSKIPLSDLARPARAATLPTITARKQRGAWS